MWIRISIVEFFLKNLNSEKRLCISQNISFSFIQETAKKAADWSREEIVALIQYVALYTEEKKWPTTKQSDFWEACATAISENTGKAVRSGEY